MAQSNRSESHSEPALRRLWEAGPVEDVLSIGEDVDKRTRTQVQRVPTRSAWHNTVPTVAAASITPILYFVWVYHYAVNSFDNDDWSVVPLLHAALHGQPTLGLLWGQHHESRLFVGNVVDLIFGFFGQFDLRSVILFNAVVFIASYALLLVLVRKYLGRSLTPIPVLVIGVTWFSLADVQNALWAFQVSWYLAVCFFLLMLCVLLVPDGRRSIWFGVAIVVAVAASLSTIQGFLCWPVGAICILWPKLSSCRRPEIATWLGAMLVTMAVYLLGYRFSAGNTCVTHAQCTPTAELHHPLTSVGFFFALIGNVVPGGTSGVISPIHDGARFVVLGLVIFVTAILVLVYSWRQRSASERLPLPALIIVFSLLFDMTITAGRGGSGVAGAVNANRFVMANLILLTGIVIYGLARIPTHRLSATRGGWRAYGTYLALGGLAAFLVVQVTAATGFGLTNGRSTSAKRTVEALTFVHFVANHPLPYKDLSPACQALLTLLTENQAALRDAAKDHLGEFEPASYRHYLSIPTEESVPACRDESAVTTKSPSAVQKLQAIFERCSLVPSAQCHTTTTSVTPTFVTPTSGTTTTTSYPGVGSWRRPQLRCHSEVNCYRPSSVTSTSPTTVTARASCNVTHGLASVESRVAPNRRLERHERDRGDCRRQGDKTDSGPDGDGI